MTSRQVLGLCIAFSLMVHFLFLQQDWTREPVVGGDDIITPLDFDVSVRSTGNPMALEQGSVEERGEEQCEDAGKRLRRLATKHYLASVHETIERHKFLPDNGDLSALIGNALFTFRILPNDTFTDIHLVRSSGDPRLDQAAQQAITTASGRTKRPKILRGRTFRITTAVKYQYNM
ncbi:TonB family protein [Pseudodesulfovibrio sp. JC047]|uniref:TonB family protein n=1 Tax=Pseudodesulfovibrio sp. JC047 TaxID=2683199 RepID=UPI0013D873CC|nr:TonB family protein [Pseudodesulfovibrio sp. JC047]NDV18464.1 TonB family protein [Pseudodesulfovibrio sp. JC047]